MSDKNLVSTEPHELNYILNRYDLSQSQKNRDLLKAKIAIFKSDTSIKPHNRENFYKFLEKNYTLYKEQAIKLGLSK